MEELSASAADKKQAKSKADPLDQYCDDNPEADECRLVFAPSVQSFVLCLSFTRCFVSEFSFHQQEHIMHAPSAYIIGSLWDATCWLRMFAIASHAALACRVYED